MSKKQSQGAKPDARATRVFRQFAWNLAGTLAARPGKSGAASERQGRK
ncbi:hypothetical protein [Pelagibacterium montanilacus]|nr:hypothetical protein [Pelagibacterium montanilacus]